MDQARRYLAKVIAWPENEEAYVNLHWSEVKPGVDRPIWSARAGRTLDDVMRALIWISSQPGRRDIYVCLSTQRIAQERTSKNGNKYLAAIRNQQNVVALKSLFLDLDAKGADKNSYANLDEAVEAFAKFINDSCMPKPTVIVRSGGGLHAYWTMVRGLTRDEWQPLAAALAEATKRHGLRCDTQCTIDSARVLRVPDTLNYKTEPPRPVTLVGRQLGLDYSVEQLWQALEPYKIAQPRPVLDPTIFPPRSPLTGINELSAGIAKREYAPVHLDDLAKECGFIREAIATGGQTYSNPMWNLTTLIATFTDDARNDAHRMGNKHPDYAKATTDEFFDRKVQDKTEKNLGVPSCATISGTGCTACQSCRHLANGRSPLAAVTFRVTTLTEPASYADPYFGVRWPELPRVNPTSRTRRFRQGRA